MPHTKSATAHRMIIRGMEWLDDWHAIGGSIGIEMGKGGTTAMVVPVAPEGILGENDRRKMIALLHDFDVQNVTIAVDVPVQSAKQGLALH